VQLIERLRQYSLDTSIRSVFGAPTLAALAQGLRSSTGPACSVPPNLVPSDCGRMTPEMLPLVQLAQSEIDQIADSVPGGAANIQDIYPLAPLQEGMLFHHLLSEI